MHFLPNAISFLCLKSIVLCLFHLSNMRPILFLHGALSSSLQFEPLKVKLNIGSNFLLLDFSGHGGKILPIGGLNFEVFVNDILTYLDANKIEKVNLFGYSMGGYAALLFAAKYPERVEKIFTCSVKLKWDLVSATKESELLNPEKILEKVPSFANNLMMLHGMNVWKNLLKSTSDMMMDLAKGKLLTDSDYANINNPVLLAIGDSDKTASLKDTVDIYYKLPKAHLLVMPNSPHEFHKLDLNLLSKEIEKFFNINN